MVLFSLFLTSKQTQSKNPTTSKLFHFRRKKQKNRTRKEKRTICCHSGPTKNKNYDQIPRETEYGTLFGPISSLFSFAHLLIKRDTGSKIVPQSDSHKKNEIGKTVNEISESKMRPLEIFYVVSFSLNLTGKQTRSKNPTTSKLFHFRRKNDPKKQKNRILKEKRTIYWDLLPIGVGREKKSPSNSEGNRIRYPLWANIFSFFYCLFADEKRHWPKNGTAVRFS